ncbi:uncharacterized protein M6B38_297795 [Iris pallida]|uniref:Uncharacterized protein n=1 Tax=Iris pallida TaxID=29817 RepID=A0AAX6FDB6_IRIPA|nr:uncharacterized protein M6B38_136710 [Iris pallida]KAJ6824971.1 uncharacterized protein M6B38_377900 [Iris pallida]KAJ6842630.1 uncharacterized protein M6B38_297795 [Iris pallida]
MNSVVKVEPEEETEEGDGERDLLLGSKPKPALVNGGGGGGLAKKRQHQRGSRRRVQWNDRNGNKLVEVLEFQPSDTSDSEDESSSGEWINYKVASFLHICCCSRGQRY